MLGNLNVRRALSLALNRQGIINSVYAGRGAAATVAVEPGHVRLWQAVFDTAYNTSPILTQNIAEAKKLVQQAGDTGKTITIGTSSQLLSIAALTGAYQAAAQAIGLKVVLRSVSAQDYVDFFIDPKFRAGIDGSRGRLRRLRRPGGDAQSGCPAGWVGELDNFSDPAITAALEQARSTANPDQRAALVAKAEELAAQQLPWIPDVQPDNVLVLRKGLTGAVSSTAYLFSPWADGLGRAG